MNPLLVTDECAVDGVDDERCPADYERDDNKNERHCDVSLLLVDLILAYRRTVSQMSSIRTDHPQHAASTYKHTQRCLQWWQYGNTVNGAALSAKSVSPAMWDHVLAYLAPDTGEQAPP